MDHHVEVHFLLFVRVYHLGKMIKRVPIYVNFGFQNDSLEFVKCNESVLVLVDVIEDVLDVVELPVTEWIVQSHLFCTQIALFHRLVSPKNGVSHESIILISVIPLVVGIV